MRFNTDLTEAVLLKRVMRFMAEIVLNNRQKMMIRCPNIGNMQGSDILGTKVWYSTPQGYHCLPTWELTEVDGGHLVCINPELMKPLVIEAIKEGLISELSDYNILHTGGHYDQFRSQFLLLEKNDKQCYLGIDQVIISNEQQDGIFPSSIGDGSENLLALIQAKRDGHRSVLLYTVLHTGINQIKPGLANDSEYSKLLREALEVGVELIAYRSEIDLHTINLTTNIPVLFPIDVISDI